MSFKNYKKGLLRPEKQALENSCHIYGTNKLPKSPFPAGLLK
jgi:hypothetical protein